MPLAIALFLMLQSTAMSLVVAQGNLSELGLYRRCYLKLTGHPPAENDPALESLAQGRLQSGVQACAQLLEAVRLDGNGFLEQRTNPVHRAVLDQIHQWHRHHFLARSITDADYDRDFSYGTMDIWDSSTAALYLTRAFFTPGLDAAYLLRANHGVVARRENQATKPHGNRIHGITAEPVIATTNQTFIDTNVTKPTLIPTTLIERGALVGISIDTDTTLLPFLWFDIPNPNSRAANRFDIATPYPLRTHHGGGALGHQAFLLMNWGHGPGVRSTGATKLPRKVIESAWRDFLCRRDSPLRVTDVAGFQAPQPVFRNMSACLRCHVSYDQAALTMSHLVPHTTMGTFTNQLRSPTLLAASRANQERNELWPSTDSSEFYRQRPRGRFMFRSISGALVDFNVNGIAELAQRMTETEDYYACLASKHLFHLTGHEVSLVDPGDVDNMAKISQATARDRELLQFVRDLGRELRATGNLKNLVKQILLSPYFQTPNFGRGSHE